MSSLLTVAAAAAILVWVLVAIVRQLSLRWHLYDHPNARSSHVVPTPRLGGVALALVLGGGFWAAGSWGPPEWQGLGWLVLAGVGTVVALVSLVDDLRPLPAVVRFAVHAGAAVTVVGLAGPLDAVGLGAFALPLPGWLGTAVVLLWVAGFINAFNFMDGIDGIAGGQALVAGLGWMLLGHVLAAPALLVAGALLVGSALGFLAHNWSPASIFMGDAGSALLGFLLSASPLLLAGPDAWLPSVLLVWPFVFDTALTLVRRAMSGEPVWQAHRTHLYQRLVACGHSHRRVATLYMALAAVGGAVGVFTVGSARGPMWMTLVIGAGAMALWFVVRWCERSAKVAALPP